MEPTLNGRDEFSLYLEASGPKGYGQRVPKELDHGYVDGVRERWRQLSLLAVRHTTREQIVSALGQPDGAENADSCAGYQLRFQPGYRYQFCFSADGILLNSEFVRLVKHELPFADFREEDPRVVVSKLIEIGATAAELLEWFGPPAERDGWWPIEWWNYGSNIRLALRNGIVCPEPGAR
jgi:hypothetical protein